MNGSAPDFPDKIYFRIGEVSQLVGVDPHVLRYWETEFAVVKPFRGKSKQRLYRRQDVENLLRIKTLLYDQGYTISGARKHLKNISCPHQSASLSESRILLLIKGELRKILAVVSGTKKEDLQQRVDSRQGKC